MRLLRPSEVAKKTGLGYDYVLSLMASGDLPPVNLPGRAFSLVDEEDVRKLIERSKPAAPIPALNHSAHVQEVPAQTAPQKKSRERKTTGQFKPNRVSIEEFRRAR